MIKFKYDGKEYQLEFSRRTVKALERSGFDVDKLGTQPATMIPMLWRGAFEMHHPRIKDEEVNTIYKRLDNKEELLTELVKLYAEPINALFDEPEDEEKKVVWEQV